MKENYSHDDFSERRARARLDAVLKAAGAKPNHLNRKVRRLLEDLLDLMWNATWNDRGAVYRMIARTVLYHVTGYRPWDYGKIAWDDPRIPVIAKAVEDCNFAATAATSVPYAAPYAATPMKTPKDEIDASGAVPVEDTAKTAPEADDAAYLGL